MILLGSITEEQYSTPELAGAPEGWSAVLGLLVLAGLGYVVFWLYRREARVGAPPRLRMALACLRSAVVLLLAVVWIEPVIATYTIRTITASVVVLTDVSASMGIVDTDEGAAGDAVDRSPTRIEHVRRLLDADDNAWLKRLASQNDLVMYTFGEQTTRRALPPSVATVAAADAPDGDSTDDRMRDDVGPLAATQGHTDMGEALATVLADLGESPVAGIVVISDGIFNRGISVEDMAARALRAKAPVHTVGVGSPLEPRNLRITGITAPATVARGDPFELQVEASAAGIERTPVRLELVARPVVAGVGGERVVATREITVGGDQTNVAVRLRIDPDVAGEMAYEAHLAALPGEAVDADNRGRTIVHVLDERLRILLVAGRPSYEYRYVARLFERDAAIDLSCWLQSADAHAVRDGNTVIAELPRTPDELFQYDALLLLDPDPREFDSAWAITVRRLVDEFAGGILLQAGPHCASRFLRDPRLEELVNILPIVPDPDADVHLSEQGAFRTRDQKVVIPAESRAHPLLRLQSGAEANQAIWDALPGVWWYLPVLREKPLATVLMRHGSTAYATRYGQPVLLAAQPFGTGRTVYLGFENTWRWRSTGELYFERFWTQLVRYLTQPRREGASKRGTIIIDRQVIRPGDYVKIEARVLDASFAPWHAGEVECRVELPDGTERTLALEAIPGRAGWFTARLAVDWAGPSVIRVPLPGQDALTGDEAVPQMLIKHLDVETSDIEMRSLAMRADQLTELAERTGADYVPLAEADSLPDRIENATRVHPVRGSERALWDNGWSLGLIATLLGVEWFVRRRNHLL